MYKISHSYISKLSSSPEHSQSKRKNEQTGEYVIVCDWNVKLKQYDINVASICLLLWHVYAMRRLVTYLFVVPYCATNICERYILYN